MKATILVDNIADNNLKSEWGLSVFIEHGGKKILLDTGASDLFIRNAQKLQLDIADADYAVLSHAHFDHADGMNSFFENNHNTKFYLQKTCAEDCYVKRLIFRKYIGIKKGTLTKYQDRIARVEGLTEISDNVYLVPHSMSGLGSIGRKEGMVRKAEGWYPSDNFDHEQSLVIDTEKGLVIFNSCSHGGVVNIIKETQKEFPGKKIYAYIGGFHIYNKSADEVRNIAEEIKKCGVERIYTGHCTGKKSFGVLKGVLGENVTQFKTGLEIEI